MTVLGAIILDFCLVRSRGASGPKTAQISDTHVRAHVRVRVDVANEMDVPRSHTDVRTLVRLYAVRGP